MVARQMILQLHHHMKTPSTMFAVFEALVWTNTYHLPSRRLELRG
jgi:hypothetical protein